MINKFNFQLFIRVSLPFYLALNLLINGILSTKVLAQTESVENKEEKESKEEKKEPIRKDKKEEIKELSRNQPSFEYKQEYKQDYKQIDEVSLFKNIDYPELQVVPRASDRLTMEAALERDRKNSFFWTLQAPAVATLVAGLATHQRYQSEPLTDQQKLDHDRNTTFAMGVGLSWLGLNYYLMNMEPYTEGIGRINKIKKTDKRSELLRERLAEEVFEKTAKTMRFVSHLSVLTNAIAILGCVDKTSTDYKVGLIIPLTISFFPYIFSQKYVDIYDKHLEYKRKIYAPISLFNIHYDQKSQTYTPVYGLAWNF